MQVSLFPCTTRVKLKFFHNVTNVSQARIFPFFHIVRNKHKYNNNNQCLLSHTYRDMLIPPQWYTIPTTSIMARQIPRNSVFAKDILHLCLFQHLKVCMYVCVCVCVCVYACVCTLFYIQNACRHVTVYLRRP